MQSLENLAYFDIFHLKKKYSINKGDLTKKYLELANLMHPDRVNATEQELAIKNAAILNVAYSVLKDDEKRAKYMLELAGYDDFEHLTSDQSFLVQALEWREMLENDPSQDALAELQKTAEQDKAELMARITGHLDQEGYDLAAKCYAKLTYINRFLEEIAVKMGI